MAGVGNDDQSLGKDRNVSQGACRRGFRDKGGIQTAVGHFVHEIIVGPRRQLETYFRVTAMKVREDARQPARSRAFQRT